MRDMSEMNRDAMTGKDAVTGKDGMTKLAPGIYDDGRGGIHIGLAELLDAHGYADTPQSRAAVVAGARDALSEMAGKPVEIVVAEPWEK